MKMFGKTEDRAIDNLLRAHTGRQSRATFTCAQFDPDLANAYVERRLTPKERQGYDRHLSECPPCRKSLVALFRMAEGVAPAPVAGAAANSFAREAGAGWLAAIRESLASVSAPRWAMAATAIVVLALSVPLLLSRQGRQEGKMAALAGDDRSAAGAVGGSSPATPAAQGETTRLALADSRGSEAKPAEGVNAGTAANQAADGARQAGPAQPPPQTQAVDAMGLIATDDAGRAAASEVQIPAATVAAPPVPPTVEQAELAKIDPEKARRLPQADKESAEMVVLKPGRPDGETKSEREMTATITPKDSMAPPPEAPAGSAASRILANRTAKRALRDSGGAKPGERGRGVPDRKAGKKRFWLINDVWTDEDYKSDKELPEVTIVRDSNVYKDLLSKYAALKPYFAKFSEGERVIVVYKGTVYKLVPPGAND
jgi:hypothetical protein